METATNTTELRRLRRERELSQADLAAACAARGVPVSRAHISLVERRQVRASARLRAALADALGVTRKELWG